MPPVADSRVPPPPLAAFFKFALESEEAAQQRYETREDSHHESDMCEQGKEHRRNRAIICRLLLIGFGWWFVRCRSTIKKC